MSFDGTSIALHQDFAYSTGGWYIVPPGPNAEKVEFWQTKQTTVTTHDYRSGKTYKKIYNYQLFHNQPSLPVETSIIDQDENGNTVRTVNKDWYSPETMKSQETILDNGQTFKEAYQWNAGFQPLLTSRAMHMTLWAI